MDAGLMRPVTPPPSEPMGPESDVSPRILLGSRAPSLYVFQFDASAGPQALARLLNPL